MKANETRIFWTPVHYDNETAGQLALCDNLSEVGMYDDLVCSGGACWTAVASEKSSIELGNYLLCTAMKLIVRDGLNSNTVHNEFMKIDEYRYFFPDGSMPPRLSEESQ